MSNDITGNPWVIDTASSTTVLSRGWRLTRIAVRWVGGSAAGHQAIINDASGRLLWKSVANGANYVEADVIKQEAQGLIVPTLDSGTLYIELD